MEPDDRSTRLLDGLRVFGAAYAEFTRRFATSLGLHATDARALIEILTAEDQGTPLTPARLAERVGLSSGAATNLVNRLESAGYVGRSREHADRRVVTLRSSPGIGEPAGAFFAPLSSRFADLVGRHDESDLAAVESFLQGLRVTMDELLGVPAEGSRSEPRSGRTGGAPPM